MEDMAKGLHDGTLKPQDLNKEAILKTYREVYKGASEGYGEKFMKYDLSSNEQQTVNSMKQNMYMFSQAKTYGMMSEMNDKLYNKDKVKPFNDFKQDVLKMNPKYNKTYLQAEYQTAKSTANHTRNWQQYQDNKDIFPNLRYKTVGDARVREPHQMLNDVVKPVNHVFWSIYYPPNGWRCRCYVEQTNDPAQGEIGNKPEKYGVPTAFQRNAAKEQKIFDEKKSPYFALTNSQRNNTTLQKNMERNKVDAPLETVYTSEKGAKVKVSPFADMRNMDEYKGNVRAAKQITHKLGLNVTIKAHLDGHIIKKEPNPEYEIAGKIADRKTTKNGNISNQLSKANKQGAETVVFDLYDSEVSIEQVKLNLKKVLKFNVHDKIKNIILISNDGNNVELIKRKDL